MRAFDETLRDIKQAIGTEDADALLALAEEMSRSKAPTAEVWTCRARGWAALVRGEYPAALELHQRALALLTDSGDRLEHAMVSCSIGNVYIRIGDFPTALECFHLALSVANEYGDHTLAAHVTSNIGVVHLSTGNYPAALDSFEHAKDMLQAVNDRHGLAMMIMRIGGVYSATADYTSALEHYQQTLGLYEELDDRGGVARVLHNIAMSYSDAGDHNAAMEYNQQALAIRKELGDHRGTMSVMSSILGELLAMGSDAEARELLATIDTMQILEPDIVVERELNRAELYVRSGSLDKAESTLQSALTTSMEHGMRQAVAATHRRLRDLAYARNDLHTYVEHNDAYTRITEEIVGKETTLKLAMQAKQHEIDAREKEIAKQLAVLHSALPEDVANRVARGEVVNDSFDNAAVLFLDIVNSTSHSSHLDAGTVVELLQRIFIAFDAICADHNVMKIKTIGDAYMAVAFPSESHIADIIAAACAMRSQQFTWPHSDEPVVFRIGMHIGPLIAGVIGTARMQYDVWGDTVNTASRMESSSEPGQIQVSQAFADAVTQHLNDSMTNDSLTLLERGTVEIKGKGPMTTYWLDKVRA